LRRRESDARSARELVRDTARFVVDDLSSARRQVIDMLERGGRPSQIAYSQGSRIAVHVQLRVTLSRRELSAVEAAYEAVDGLNQLAHDRTDLGGQRWRSDGDDALCLLDRGIAALEKTAG
jgi:hypothetical protein